LKQQEQRPKQQQTIHAISTRQKKEAPRFALAEKEIMENNINQTVALSAFSTTC